MWKLKKHRVFTSWCVNVYVCEYLPIICNVQRGIAHAQGRAREFLQDDNLPTSLAHGGHASAVPEQVPAGVRVDVAHHGGVDVPRLAQLLPDPHQHRLTGVLLQEGVHGLQHVPEVGVLVRDAVVDGEVAAHVAHADVQEADASAELVRERPGLALGQATTVQRHGVVGAGHRDLGQRATAGDVRHPGGVEELGCGGVIVVWALEGATADTDQPVWTRKRQGVRM